MNLLAALAMVLLLNLPFGWWREGLKKLSAPWFVAVHAPIPFIFVVRRAFDLPWRLETLPLFVAAYFLGQWAGGRIRRGR